jgi:hypothetical protein
LEEVRKIFIRGTPTTAIGSPVFCSSTIISIQKISLMQE